MAMIDCRIHGISFVAHICPHIKQAVIDEVDMPRFIIYDLLGGFEDEDDYWLTVQFCHQCAREKGLPDHDVAISEIDQAGKYKRCLEVEVICGKCFDERVNVE